MFDTISDWRLKSGIQNWVSMYPYEISWSLLEPICCKKRQKTPNQETGLGTSEGSEWYQIGPKWAWLTPLII